MTTIIARALLALLLLPPGIHTAGQDRAEVARHLADLVRIGVVAWK